MRNFLVSGFLLGLLCACSAEKSDIAAAPPPGFSTLPRASFLLDGRSKGNENQTEDELSRLQSWFWPQVDSPQSGPGRIVFEGQKVDTLESAKELLQVWNARPMQVLILGPGFPQSASIELKLPKVVGRKVIALEPVIKGAPKDWIRLSAKPQKIDKFLAELCALPEALALKGCHMISGNWPQSKTEGGFLVSMGQERLSDPQGRPVTVSVHVDWQELIRGILLGHQLQELQNEGAMELDFGSSYLAISLNKGSLEKLSQEKLNAWISRFRLEQLGSQK